MTSVPEAPHRPSAHPSSSSSRPASTAASSSSSSKPATRPLAPFKLTLDTPDENEESSFRATVCEEAVFKGNVSVGCGTVIHPRARILSHNAGGSIRIGKHCLIEEEVVIENSSDEVMTIGDENTFEVGAWIEAASVGNLNTFGVKCHVTQELTLENRCVIGPGTTLSSLSTSCKSSNAPEVVPSYTVTYGSDSRRRKWDGSGQEQARAARLMHLAYLREVLPKYNHIRKS